MTVSYLVGMAQSHAIPVKMYFLVDFTYSPDAAVLVVAATMVVGSKHSQESRI